MQDSSAKMSHFDLEKLRIENQMAFGTAHLVVKAARFLASILGFFIFPNNLNEYISQP